MNPAETIALLGLEPTTQTIDESSILPAGGAKSGALAPQSAAIDPELATIMDAWPKLPGAIRAGILAMVRAAGG